VQFFLSKESCLREFRGSGCMKADPAAAFTCTLSQQAEMIASVQSSLLGNKTGTHDQNCLAEQLGTLIAHV
jgi:hypothetical protein